MKLYFYKYQGAGNDFILLDNRRGEIKLSRGKIETLCNRRFGIGADGLMLLENASGYDFKMVYYNSDGRESSMCGNGGRCIVAFAKKLGIIKDTANFIAIDGPHDALVKDNWVSLGMKNVDEVENGKDYFFLDTGSPHYVRFVDKLNDYNVFDEARKVRYSERFREKGTNVNFVERVNGALHVRTYERGVEDETLACGTGVTAACLVASIKGLSTAENECAVVTPGGKLNVKFEKKANNTFHSVRLEGPAEFVFEGTIQI